MPRLALFAALLLAGALRPAAAQDLDADAPVLDAPPRVVMNLAAHPDDEDGRTLAYYRHAHDALAYSVIFTRGEGGQNEIGPELYEALGAIRTDETERAARHLGTQVLFLNFDDFGYSKQASEAFEQWGGRDAVTARLVYLLRSLKPDVLFTNHDTVTVGPRRQHGQHQAVGLAAYDAFALAADSSYHPEQLAEPGVDLWQPKRLFLRLWGDEGEAEVEVPVADAVTADGRSANDLAVAALFEHASQGMGMWADRLRTPTTRFVLLRSATDAPLDSTDLTGHLPPNTAAAMRLPAAVDSGRLPRLPAGALAVSDSVVVPGQEVLLTLDRAAAPAGDLRWTFHGAVDTTVALPARAYRFRLRVPADAAPTLPKAERQYDRFVSHPPVTYAVYAEGDDRPAAAGYVPLEIAPPLTVAIPEEVVRLRPGANAVPFEARWFAPGSPDAAVLAAVRQAPDAPVLYQQRTPLTFGTDGLRRDTLTLDLPRGLVEGGYVVDLTATADGDTARAAVPARTFSVRVPQGLRVGVVESYDDALDRALTELGVDHVLLDSAALAAGDLDTLHTIVVDIRAYLVRPDLRAHNDRLLAWVERGGHLVVNYQKTFEWNPQYDDPFLPGVKNPDGFAPYPLMLGRDRVTREDAPVTILEPEHLLFNRPNNIRAAAWDGWVQERGLYFPAAYAGNYRELLAMNDPGEASLPSSTLIARHGEGTYLYTALGWYRQLKAFHPGAYALFANMVSLPLVDGRAAVDAASR